VHTCVRDPRPIRTPSARQRSSRRESTSSRLRRCEKFLDSGGRIGLQHDPLLYGSYALNPYLVRVQTVPMLLIPQGEVAVIKAAVGQQLVLSADVIRRLAWRPGDPLKSY
jgi:hypothetical protein